MSSIFLAIRESRNLSTLYETSNNGILHINYLEFFILRITDQSKLSKEEIEHINFISAKFSSFCENVDFEKQNVVSQNLFEEKDKSKMKLLFSYKILLFL